MHPSTHDRRVRVFVSSTLVEAAAERLAARAAIEDLHLTPVMFEQGARPYPPQELYRSYLEQSDVFIGIYADQYGWIGPGATISGLEDELVLSGNRPKLMYLKTPAPDRDPRLTDMIRRIHADANVSSTNYTDADHLHRLIADDLAVLLSERFALPAELSRDDGLHPIAVPAPATALIGREAELSQAGRLLVRDDVRLLTLTGMGGIGKTRLAIEIARDLGERFDFVAYADLSPVTQAGQVAAALATAVGVGPEGSRDTLDVLVDRLHDRQALIVVDNFEHVLPAATDLARLIRECPRLTFLVTSRIALDVRAEQELPIGPLQVADSEQDDDLEAIRGSSGVALFVARTRQYRPGFTVDADNAAAIAAIVRRLDGIPLAIELACARMRLLTPQQLLDRLGDTLDLTGAEPDAPVRQRTLRDTIEWSYGLLTDPERELLDQLSVFPSAWTLTAAEAVVDLPPGTDLLDTLSALIQHSLVVPDARSRTEPRFRTFQAVRRFALERLVDSGRFDPAMERLAEHLRLLGTEVGSRVGGARRALLEVLDGEMDAFRAVLEWALKNDRAELLVRVSAPLSRYLWTRGMLDELDDLVEQTSALPSAATLPPDAADLLAWSRASIRFAVGRTAGGEELAQQVVRGARDRDDRWLLAHGLVSLALTLPCETEAARMRDLLNEAIGLFERQDDTWGVSFCLIPLGEIALRDGDVTTATHLHERALAGARRIDDDHMIGQCLNQVALDALLRGEPATARDLLMAAADVYRRLPDQEGLAYCLDGFAGLLLGAGQAQPAARLLGTAQRVREVAGLVVWPLMQPLADALTAGVRAQFDAGTFTRLTAEGAATAPIAALDAAIEASAATPVPGSG